MPLIKFTKEIHVFQERELCRDNFRVVLLTEATQEEGAEGKKVIRLM